MQFKYQSNKSRTFNKLASIVLLSLAVVSCNKDDDDPPPGTSYPKEVQITYKMSSTNTTTAQAISYKNESGGMSTVTNVTLPYSKTITRTVNKYDDASIGYSSTNIAANVRLEIEIGNAIVKSQDFEAGTGALVYLFQ